MQVTRRFGGQTFSSLRIRNYRLYFIGQGISLSGTWMQTIAQDLLVLKLTGSGTALGFVTALQALPVLFLGPWGGVIADRFPKRPTLYVTQATSGILALILGTLVVTSLIHLWMVYILAFLLGFVKVVDNPTRQVFVLEMVGREQLTNAVALNSSEINLARVIGPSIAGALIAAVGLGPCFLINGVSYVAVLVVLYMMREQELRPAPLVPRAKGQLQAGLRYVKSSPALLTPLLMMVVIGTLTYEFSVVLPLFARFTFHGGAGSYAALTAAMGLGAVIGGVFTAGRAKPGMRRLLLAALLFGLTILLTAVTPSLMLAILALVLVGFFSIMFTSLANSTLQLESAPDMRGRVMALWTVAFLGSTPIGGPLIGWIGQTAGARWALVVGGAAAIAAAGLGALVLSRTRQRKTRGPLAVGPVEAARGKDARAL